MVNIFFTDWDPVVAARDSCDSYVVKIPVEVALLLSALHWRTGYEGPVSSGLPLVTANNGDVLPAVGPYRDSKVIKSSSETYRWLAKGTGNYEYAVAYGLELIEEYKRRYGGTHATESVLLWLKANVPCIRKCPMTTDVGLGMPDKYKDGDDPVASYRRYILGEKMSIAKWERGARPAWLA